MNKTPRINPIETLYNGIRFRSRLEARWAVFFDALEIKWEYEPEAYSLPSGNYLPDFFLPGQGDGEGPMHLEVKPFPCEDARWACFRKHVGLLAVVFGPPQEGTLGHFVESAGSLILTEGCTSHTPYVFCSEAESTRGPIAFGKNVREEFWDDDLEKIRGAQAYARGYRFWG